jgi:hypothetical protein
MDIKDPFCFERFYYSRGETLQWMKRIDCSSTYVRKYNFFGSSNMKNNSTKGINIIEYLTYIFSIFGEIKRLRRIGKILSIIM